MSLKYLTNFWRSLEILLINCKVKLKLKWAKCFSAAGNDNTNPNPNNIIFTIKDTKLYVSLALLSAKDNKKLSKLLKTGMERLAYWNEYKTKTEKKIQQMSMGVFSSHILSESIDYLILFIQIKITMLKDLTLQNIFYQIGILIIATSSSMKWSFVTNSLILI